MHFDPSDGISGRWVDQPPPHTQSHGHGSVDGSTAKIPSPTEVSENLRGEAKNARLKSIGLYTLGGLGTAAAGSMVVLGGVAVLGGVGTLPFFGAGTAGIVVGSALIGAGVGLGFLSACVFVGAREYQKDAVKLENRTILRQIRENMDPGIEDDEGSLFGPQR